MRDSSRLPAALRPLAELLSTTEALIALGVFSIVMFGLSLVGVPLFLARLPADYYSRRERRQLGLAPRSPVQWVVVVLKNAAGLVLIALGLLMFVLPGQGLLTLLVGIMLVDFPGKLRLERRIIGSPRVLRLIDSWRRRAGRPPLEMPSRDGTKKRAAQP